VNIRISPTHRTLLIFRVALQKILHKGKVLFPLSTATCRDSLSNPELSQRLLELSTIATDSVASSSSSSSTSKTAAFPPPSLLVMGTPDAQQCAFLVHDQKHQSAKSSSSSAAEKSALARIWSTVTTLTVANVFQCAAHWYRWSMQCGVLAYQCTLQWMGNWFQSRWFMNGRRPLPQPDDDATPTLARESRPHGD
jgi:hypothetical protein